MTKSEIKQNIHSLVETLDNENILIQVKEMLESINNDPINFINLNIEVQNSITKGIEQLDIGEKIIYADIKKNFPEWLRK